MFWGQGRGGGAEGKVNEENISGALRKKKKNLASTYPPDTLSAR